jgi:hypothetical protein
MGKQFDLWAGVTLLAAAISGPLADAEEPGARPEPARAAPIPLVDIWWNLGDDRPFESVGIDVTIEGDPAAVGLEIAPLGLEVSHRKRSGHGPGIEAIAIIPRPLTWAPGRYRFEVSRVGKQADEGTAFTRFDASLRRAGSDKPAHVASFRVPGEGLLLSRQVACSVAIRATDPPPGVVPRMTITFCNLRVDGKPVEGLTALAEYPEGGPKFVEATGQGTSVVVTLGRPSKERRRRRIDLVGSLANRPESGLPIGKFELLATFTYAKALHDGFPDDEAKVRGITAAVMGARARGLKRPGPQTGDLSDEPKAVPPGIKTRPLTARHFDRQISERMGDYFSRTFLPTMQRLVKARLSYERLKQVLSMTPEMGAKITAEEFERRASAFLKGLEPR